MCMAGKTKRPLGIDDERVCDATIYVERPDEEPQRDSLEGYDQIYFKVERYSNGLEFSRPDKPIEQFTAKELGSEGERLAVSYLENRGYEVMCVNWFTPFGEADIVARDPEGTVTLVEVKTRLALGQDSDLMPELAVDGRKQGKYRAMALYYLAVNNGVDSVRFDVIALNIIGERSAKLRHLTGAFGWDQQ